MNITMKSISVLTPYSGAQEMVTNLDVLQLCFIAGAFLTNTDSSVLVQALPVPPHDCLEQKAKDSNKSCLLVSSSLLEECHVLS